MGARTRGCRLSPAHLSGMSLSPWLSPLKRGGVVFLPFLYLPGGLGPYGRISIPRNLSVSSGAVCHLAQSAAPVMFYRNMVDNIDNRKRKTPENQWPCHIMSDLDHDVATISHILMREIHQPINRYWLQSPYLAPVVQTSDSAIHRINHYPADCWFSVSRHSK